MAIFDRTLAALALALVAITIPPASAAATATAIASPSSPAAKADGENLADEVRAFKAEKFREIDEAVLELRALIEEKTRFLSQLEAELHDAHHELMDLERLASYRSSSTPTPSPSAPPILPSVAPTPSPSAPPIPSPATTIVPTVAPSAPPIVPPTAPVSPPGPPLPTPTVLAHPIPGTLDAVVPASATLTETGWQGIIRIISSAGGRLDLLHESGDGSGKVQAGALQAEVIEIRVASPQDARVISQALKADSHAVVTWPDLRVAPDPQPQDGRIEAMEATLHRIAKRLDQIDRRDSATTSPPTSDPVVVEPPDEIPPAPSIPE